jgi:RNA polymerase sigma-70 factor (ECF subfamily)
VRAAQNGDEGAHAVLYQRYAKMVDRLAYHLTGSGPDAEDLAQDVFVEAMESIHHIREPAAFAQWLRSLTFRTATRRWRRQRLQKLLGLRRAAPIDVDQLVSSTAPPEVSWELRCVYRHLDKLPPKVRIPFVLSRVEGLSLGEIAAELGRSEGTIKRSIRRAEQSVARFQGRGADF